MKDIVKTIALFTALFFSISQAKAQDTKDNIIAGEVNMQHYTFVAQSAQSASGKLVNLTSLYTLTVSKDTVQSDLPYFGRAYSASIGSSEGGIHFTSTKFSYTSSLPKNGGWDILIKPKDAPDVQQLILNISSGGYGTLQVISVNRQVIIYNGYITSGATP